MLYARSAFLIENKFAMPLRNKCGNSMQPVINLLPVNINLIKL